MTITKKLELATRLKREMDSAIEALMKRDGLMARAAAVDGVILSLEVSQAHRRERQETSLEEEIHGRVSKDAIKTADEAIDALAEQHRTRHPGMTHAQCVEYVITAIDEGKRFFAESRQERLRKATRIT